MHVMTKARSRLIVNQPFFGHLAMRHKVVSDPTVETIAINGETLRYNEEYVHSLRPEELRGQLTKAVMHIACQHHLRRGGRDTEEWNIACSYVVNGLLEQSKIALPKDALVDHTHYDGKSAEEVFALREVAKRTPGQGPEPQQGRDKDGEGDQGNKGSKPDDNKNGQNKDGKQPANDPGNCGAVVLDAPHKGHPGRPDAGPTKAEMDKLERDSKHAVVQAMQSAKRAGNIPAFAERLVKETIESETDWRMILRQFMGASARDDYSWSRPNRRYVATGLYLPALYSESVGEMVIVIDVSGSINQPALNAFAGEMDSIVQDVGPSRVHVMYCNTQVTKHEEFLKNEPIVIKAKGGGGTDFRPPFKLVDDLGIEPKCLIYFTDLICHRWPPEPSYPVLWAVCPWRGHMRPHISQIRTARFGETINLK